MEHLAKGGDLVAGSRAVGLGHFRAQGDDGDRWKATERSGGRANAARRRRPAPSPFGKRRKRLGYAGPDRHGHRLAQCVRAVQGQGPGQMASGGRQSSFCIQHEVVPASGFPPDLRQARRPLRTPSAAWKVTPATFLLPTHPAKRECAPRLRRSSSIVVMSARPIPRPLRPGDQVDRVLDVIAHSPALRETGTPVTKPKNAVALGRHVIRHPFGDGGRDRLRVLLDRGEGEDRVADDQVPDLRDGGRVCGSGRPDHSVTSPLGVSRDRGHARPRRRRARRPLRRRISVPSAAPRGAGLG